MPFFKTVFLFILLFLYAAGVKLADYKLFVGQIGLSPLLTKYAGTIAWMIPTVEIVIAIMLMVPRFRLTGLYAAFGLMIVFTFYIIAILSLSAKLPCACGGVISKMGWKNHLLFNIAFDLLGLTAIILTSKKEQINKAEDQNTLANA